MNKIQFAIFLGATCTLLIFSGCVQKRYTAPVLSKEAIIDHKYNIKVVDEMGTPVEGATLEYTLIVPGYTDISETTVIGKNGYVYITGKTHSGTVVQPNGNIYHYAGNKSTIKYRVIKKNHFLSNGEIQFECGEEKENGCVKEQTIVACNYISRTIKQPLRDKVEKVVSQIMIEAFLRDSLLATEPVTIENFKGNPYIKMNLINLTTYNSIKLNKYDIGKVLFDDVIRKILTHLDSGLHDSSDFYGYELTIRTSSKNFVGSSHEEQIEYKFFLPKKMVSRYKDMDVSGQTLLDSSIILQNGERVELKLQ